MQITVSATKVGKSGKSDKGPWELIVVTSEDGTDYTTFHTGAKHLSPGTIIDIGQPKIEAGKCSFKEYKIISEPTTVTPTTSSGREGPPDMTPEMWAEKDRLERWSRECNACFMGLPELLKSEPGEGKAKEAYDLALDYAMAHFRLPKPGAKIQPPAPKTVPQEPQGKVTTSDEDWDAVGSTFENKGEFYTACLKRWGLQKSEVDKETAGFDLSTDGGRHDAWLAIEAVRRVR